MTEVTTMEECKGEFITSVTSFFEGQRSNLLSDVWDVCVLVAENVSGLDWNSDGVVRHSKEEILAVMKDKSVEFGAGLTSAVINLATGGWLKKLFAAANVAVILAKIGISSQIPFAPVIIDLCLEWVVSALKAGLAKIQNWFNKKIDKYKGETQAALGKLLQHFTSTYSSSGITFNTEHEFGVNMFTLLASKGDEHLRLIGSVRLLTTIIDKEDQWSDLMDMYEAEIEKEVVG